MYSNVFEQHIKKELPKALLMHGVNIFMFDYYIEYYMEKLGAKDDALKIYFDEWDFGAAKTYLSQSSLFGGTNLLIVKHNKVLPAKELKELQEIACKGDDNYFIYILYDDENDRERAKKVKSISTTFNDKNGTANVRFFEPNQAEMIKILTHKAQSFGTQIEQHAISHLIILLNHNMALCVNELEKLSILGRVVSEKDIDYLVHSNAPLSVDSMIVELLCKRAFLEMLNKLLELGNDSADILKSLERSISEILQFQAYIKTNGGINAIEILGYNPPKHILDTKSRLANTIKPQTLLKIFETIIELGDELRSAKNPQKEALLYAIMLKIQALL